MAAPAEGQDQTVLEPERRPVLGIFSGGGTKAIAFVGALREAEQHVQLVGWGGTSAGSIVAALLACGYRAEELQKLLYEAPYADFFKISPLRVAFIQYYRGAINPLPLLRWLRSAIASKFDGRQRINFTDLPADRLLKIVAANVSTQQIQIYSRNDTPTEEIAQAVLASCSVPVMFPPARRGNDDLVDGGVFSNFPMWLFDDEREKTLDTTPVLGFSLISDRCAPENSSFLEHVYSVFESVLVAQDRVQEKYMDISRVANVIRISVPSTRALSRSVCCDRLLLCGREAASEYFRTATMRYGEPVSAPSTPCPVDLMRRVAAGDYMQALSIIARQHILHGGVARDEGLTVRRVLVRYYIDLMGAATDHEKLEALATLLARKIDTLSAVDRLIGIKKGNLLLAYRVARLLKKPLSLFKTDMSYKMGPPFDGGLKKNERVLIVDDIASDSSILTTAVRQLTLRGARVMGVATLQ
ncbi:MAG: patatin-like phospholipase family protein [Pseudomonadota bacterium]|nr:patatin-like phospholipase family protein [Pseudomonadota bacterium]